MIPEGSSAPAGADDDGEGLDDDGEAMLASWRAPARPRRYRKGARWSGGEPGPARRTLTVRLAEDEIADLRAAAERAGLTTSGYIARTALAAARDQPPPADYDAVLALVRAAREALRIGGNLNQAVRALHATGQPSPSLERIAAATLEAVRRMEAEHLAVVDSYAGRTRRRRRRATGTPDRPHDPAPLAGAAETEPDATAAPVEPARSPKARPPVGDGTIAGRLLAQRRAAAGEE